MLDFSTSIYPQINGLIEKTIQVIEDILRACIFDFGGY